MANIVDILLKVKDQTKGELKKVREDLKKLGSAGEFVADNLGKLSLAGIAAGFKSLGQSVIESTKALSEEAKVLTNLSEQAGFSTKTIQGFTFAAEQLGIDTGDATDFLRDFNFEIGEASLGGSDAENKFKNLGVSIRTTSGALKDNDTILRDTANALAGIQDSAQRAALAAKLFGEDNQKLLPILTQGAEGLQNYITQLEAMGAVIDDVAIAKLSEFDETMRSIADSQKQLQIESIETAKLAATVSEIWTIGLNEVSKAVLNADQTILNITESIGEYHIGVNLLNKGLQALIGEDEDHNKAMKEKIKLFEEQEKARLRDQQSQVKTIEQTEEETKELEKLIKTQIKQAEALRKQEKAREDLQRDIQNQIDLLKAEQAVSRTEAAGLRRGVREREIEADIEKLREQGAEEEQLEELRRLKLEELNKEVEETTESVDRSTDSMREYRETVDDTTDSVDRNTESMERLSESSQKAAGGLADALTGMDRIGAQAFEFLIGTGISPTGEGAFGTAGIANDPESLLLAADVAKARALQDTIAQAQQGIIQIGDDVLRQYIEEFNQLSQNLGFGQRISETGRQGALLGGESKVSIEFNPNQDFDNLSISSQRQLAEQIAMAAGMR